MKKILIIPFLVTLFFALFACRKSETIEIVIGMWPESANTDDVAMFNVWKERFETDYPQFQTWFTEPQMIVSGGHAKDITDIVDNLGWTDHMDEALKSYLTFDDRLYGIPRDGYGLGLLINLNVFFDAGLVDDLDFAGIYDIVDPANPEDKHYPVTMEELFDYAQDIKDSTGTDGLIRAFGAELQTVDEDDQVHANLNSDEAVEAMEFLKGFYDHDLVPVGNMNYSEWATRLGNGQIGMAIAGNDVISNVITQGGMDRNDIAFVPIPAGPAGQYTLFGGTPYMFSAYDSDEAVEGAIRFLEYIGRSPEVSDVAQKAMREGLQTAARKNMLILPEVRPWVNDDYVTLIESLNAQYVNVSAFHNFADFYEELPETRRREEPYYTQYMYELLDQVVVNLKNPGFDVRSSLNSKQALFEAYLREKLD